MEEADQDVIDVARMGDDAFVRVTGKGSFKNSPTLKSFCLSSSEDGAQRFVIDMGGCDGMDSTFMGVVSGLARRLNVGSDKVISMVNLSPENDELLSTLGVTFLIETYDAAASVDIIRNAMRECGDLDRLAECDGRDRLTVETMLSAHRELCDVDDDNLPRFENVIGYLEAKLSKLDDGATSP